MMPYVTILSRHDSRRLVELLLVDGDHHRGIQVRKALASAEVAEGARERYDVTQVATLREALDTLAARHFDAVLLNLFVPDSLGLGTLREVRRRAPDTPVIALGRQGTEHAAATAIEAGALDFLPGDQTCEAASLARAVRGAIGENDHAEADRFLWEASDALASALDLEEVGRAICGLAISRLAGCCILDVQAAGGPVRRVAVAHCSSEWNERLAPLTGTYLVKADLTHPVVRVFFTGREEHIEQAPEGWARSLAYREADDGLLSEIDVRSALLVPLKARRRTVGVLTLLGSHLPAFTRHGRDLAARLALPAGFAIDNALLVEQAEDAVRERRKVLATTSHDLRTPLTSMRGGLGLLGMRIEDRLTSDERDLLGNVHRNVVRLGEMLTQLLEHNQIELGGVKFEIEPVNLAEIVQQTAEAARTWTLEKGQILRVYLPAVIPYEGDPAQLERVILLLLDNAYRHTPPGTTITVSGRMAPNNIVLAIHDSGPGIPTEEHEAIFRRFYRGSRGARGTGLGLGLAIARAIVESHGGRLSVDSAPGAGTTFYITLPTHIPDQGLTGPD